MSDHNEGECKSTAEEHHHHSQQTPLVVNGEGQVLSKEEYVIGQCSTGLLHRLGWEEHIVPEVIQKFKGWNV